MPKSVECSVPKFAPKSFIKFEPQAQLKNTLI